jgi:LacI family transcriptional regulator
LRAALRGAGILATESLIRTTDHAGANAVPVFRELMEQEPTALILGGTRITAAIVDELSDMSVAIPKQLSLIGFGERSWSKWWGPGLTTIAMPCRDLAIAAGKHLVSRIDPASSEKAPRAVRTTSLLPGLNLRGSTSRCRN